MVRTGKRFGDRSVYDVADRFRELGLRQRQSVFDPLHAAWSLESFRELEREFASEPDTSGGSFESKLKAQLERVNDDARLLMAELLTLHLLITTTIGRPKKEEIVGAALGMMSDAPRIPVEVGDAFSNGFVNPGTYFNTGRPAQLRYLVRVGMHLASLPTERLESVLDDPWAFREEVGAVEVDGAATQRHALLHLLFPETYEAIVSNDHRLQIVEHFGQLDGLDPTGDDDRDLLAIRGALSEKYGDGFDFYSPRLKPLWAQGADPWNALVRWTSKIYMSDDFDETERDYKLKAVAEFAQLDDAIRSDGDWLEALRRLQQNGNNNLLDYRAADDFLKWVGNDSDRARRAIIDLWDSTATTSERVQRFADTVGKGLSSPGNRTAQAAYLLMATDPAQWPMYRPEPYKTFLKLVGAAHRSSEGDRYAQAIQTCDELCAELEGRTDVILRDRLDAQSLIWAITKARPDGPLLAAWSEEERNAFLAWRDGSAATITEKQNDGKASASEPDQATDEFGERLSSAAAKTHLPVAYLRNLTDLLLKSDKKQMVLYGPPGTGKTFVAQQLSYIISGREPEIVQFHPSTTYEDFFEGIRPITSDDGSIRYVVQPGPMAALAAEADDNRDRDYVLIIDELNRANLAKVLGELLFLFEYRDVRVRTLYRGEQKFGLPPNVFVIATMNTVDRSVALIDAAMRRRFHFVSFYPDDRYLSDVLGSVCSEDEAWVEQLVKRVNEDLVREFGSRDYQLGWSHFIDAERNEAGVEQVWKHTIEPLIEDHLFGEPDRMKRFRWASVYQRHVDDVPEESDPHPDASGTADD